MGALKTCLNRPAFVHHRCNLTGSSVTYKYSCSYSFSSLSLIFCLFHKLKALTTLVFCSDHERWSEPVTGVSHGIKGDEVVLKFSMKNWLVEACKVLGMDTPEYFPYPVKIMNGSPHHSYMCFIRSPKIQGTPVEVGPHATTPELAMENVSLQWLKRLEKSHHLAIVDYNQHKVQERNERIKCLEVENFDLVMENSSLKQQNMDLRSMLHYH